MELELYVGTLTRYYAGDGQDSDDDLRLSVLMWRDSLSLALEEHLEDPLDWDESAAAPRFTAELGWQGYGALLLWAAYAEHPELPRPTTATAEWESDPAYRASVAVSHASRYGQLLYGPELWLPCSFGFTFHAEDVWGDQVAIGSSVALLAELQALNTATWHADAPTLAGWRRAGAPHGEAALESWARYGLAVFFEQASRSVAHGLPMRLRYQSRL